MQNGYTLRNAAEEAALDLNKIASAMQLVMDALYGDEDESTERDVFSLTFDNLIGVRDM